MLRNTSHINSWHDTINSYECALSITDDKQTVARHLVETSKFPTSGSQNLRVGGLFVRLMRKVTKIHLYHLLVLSDYCSL